MTHQLLPEENFGVSVHTGFPNPALDASTDTLDLNKLIIRHPAGTYFMRITGNDWHMHGIFDGDLAVIDRVISSQPNDLVIWWEGESFIISQKHRLPLDTPQWGVVTAVIHLLGGRDA